MINTLLLILLWLFEFIKYLQKPDFTSLSFANVMAGLVLVNGNILKYCAKDDKIANAKV